MKESSFSDGKFGALMNNIKDKEDCFTSTLVMRDLASDDMRSYKLIVENVHGIDSLQVNLTIEGKSTEIIYRSIHDKCYYSNLFDNNKFIILKLIED